MNQENTAILDRIARAAGALNRSRVKLSRTDRYVLGMLAWAPRNAAKEGCEFVSGSLRTIETMPVEDNGRFLFAVMAAGLALRDRAGGADFARQIDDAVGYLTEPLADEPAPEVA